MIPEKLENPKIKNFWHKDGLDFIADLGSLKKAIVVAFYVETLKSGKSWYSISPRSFFPFTNKQYETKYDTAEECIAVSESIVLAWVKSLVVQIEPTETEKKLISSN